jgi:hypothetical protein
VTNRLLVEPHHVPTTLIFTDKSLVTKGQKALHVKSGEERESILLKKVHHLLTKQWIFATNEKQISRSPYRSKILVGNPKENRSEDPEADGRIMLKWIFGRYI